MNESKKQTINAYEYIVNNLDTLASSYLRSKLVHSIWIMMQYKGLHYQTC